MEKYFQYNTGVKGLPSKVHYWKLSDSDDGFNILVYSVSDHEDVINIFFESVKAYRSINEGDRLKLWSEISIEDDTFIFIVENSKYLEYFYTQSKNIHKHEQLKHYFVMTTDDCIDVITTYDPSVSKN